VRRGAKARLLVAALLLGAAAFAHIRLVNPSNGAKLHWAAPTSIRVVISSAGSDDIPNGLHFPALRNAIAAWNAETGTTEHLTEDTSPTEEARTDWQDDALHQILFDETNASGYFPSGTGIVALTPVWFAGDGHITDADILFNGSTYSFTTSGEPNRFDVQDVATHELGHFLGLDHSGWAGASMYPYVNPIVILHRSLSLDEMHGMRDAYPAATFASITGTIRRQTDGTVVPGAHVVARDLSGRTTAGALANAAGVFRLAGLDPGTYQVYATPLDSPVSAGNLGGGNTVKTDFESTIFGRFTVSAAQGLAAGDLSVAPDVALGLGRTSDALPLRCVVGQTRMLQLRGVGLVPGSSLTSSDPTLTVVPLSWLSGAVTFQVTVPADAAPGHVDLTVTDPGGARSILPAAIEITPPNPIVANVAPASGNSNGGTPITIHGSGFAAGDRVVLGANVYPDGEPGGCTVVDGTTIQLVTAATPGGVFDAVVIDASGVEGRETNAFSFFSVPVISSVFPTAGSATGGTSVVIRGSEFVTGCTVSIDGVAQTQVTVDDPTRITLVTDPGTAGGPYTLSVVNAGGGTSSASFSYTAESDPSLLSVSPPGGTTSGGDSITLAGANLPANAAVVFGADPDTGLGGVPAESVTWIDATTIDVVTPTHGSGTVSVLVRDPASGQATLLPAAYAYAPTGGGGGGGCSIAPAGTPRSPFDPLAGSAWILAVASILLLRARRAQGESSTA
jgi:hypothetical protein